jgi:hypothetical protein
MLELAFRHGVFAPGEREAEKARLEHALAAGLAAGERDGARASVAALLAAVGVRPHPRDDAYFAEALAFHLAQVCAHLQKVEEMANYVARSRTLPADGGNFLFSEHVDRSLRLHQRREAARERGLPTFMIAAMPRAASASLTQTLAQSLAMPLLRISLGAFPHYALAPSWLNAVSPGGAVLHDHFGATPENLAVLRAAGVREVFVLVRDPRAAAASYVKWIDSTGVGPVGESPEALALSAFQHGYLPWLQAWIAASNRSDLHVRWIHSRQVSRDFAGVWRDLLSAHAPLYPALTPFLDVAPAPVRANFVQGDDDRWRTLVGESTRQDMWAALSPAAIELLELEP